jgi:hypothetical protein
MPPTPISLIAVGHLPAEAITPLLEKLERIEVLELDIPPRDPLAKHRAETHRAIDAAANDWILIVREREIIDAALAEEIAEAIAADRVHGFRIRTEPTYAGAPLRIGSDAGEVRLFHRRAFLRFANKGEWPEITVQGSVVRMQRPFRTVTFLSAQEHEDYLTKSAVRHSALRHMMIFARNAMLAGTFDRNTLRYLWIEAGFDHGDRKPAAG